LKSGRWHFVQRLPADERPVSHGSSPLTVPGREYLARGTWRIRQLRAWPHAGELC
jgi:hypothetical protein